MASTSIQLNLKLNRGCKDEHEHAYLRTYIPHVGVANKRLADHMPLGLGEFGWDGRGRVGEKVPGLFGVGAMRPSHPYYTSAHTLHTYLNYVPKIRPARHTLLLFSRKQATEARFEGESAGWNLSPALPYLPQLITRKSQAS